ncbi:hypothetical protein CH249_01745 [Rhodococcus sp. 05-2255-3B1]|uniref:DUF2637 domain-containing protein n=1 Tax=unclassified Rhodococcus (in: high G+C Gram-positive bacteria) TaxID=192944 RepID=UPI000B9C25CD|nr:MULTISPECIES: DUF2637 domain-containing protein [unclassified Rhodococcus (in: high G+C Gram-positive bacteria)]OZE13393.1 hypothetical protein CH250_05620 [Rhodococcus sp. 05-2255-3C]OZE15994.1 hypothetical protein CH249_01745 [Rhodococcus sp. 05-2255-3B1]OZE19034.1 hypothetical protein CH255_13770 [Rhodococcus sp. 05-2255-2A2]
MTRPRITAHNVAVAVAILVATGSSILSFTALADLAAHNEVPASLAWIVPLIVDATVLGATLAVVALDEGKAFAWSLLALSAALSISGNVAHVWDSGPIAIAIAAVPPVLLLATTHLVVLLSRRSVPAADEHELCKPVPLWPADVKNHKSSVPDLAGSWKMSREQESAAA